MKNYQETPCWVVRDSAGLPWDEDHDSHHDTREDADAWIRDLIEDIEDGYSGIDTPELEDEQRVTRVLSLRPFQLDGVCYTVTCNGCGDGPESDEFDHVHFGPDGEFDPSFYDFSEVGGEHFCGECRPIPWPYLPQPSQDEAVGQ